MWMGEDHILCTAHLLAQVVEFGLAQVLTHGWDKSTGASILMGFEDVEQVSDNLGHVG